jgi:hypothetical protein
LLLGLSLSFLTYRFFWLLMPSAPRQLIYAPRSSTEVESLKFKQGDPEATVQPTNPLDELRSWKVCESLGVSWSFLFDDPFRSSF